MPGNRRQKVMVAPEILDKKIRDKKNALEGQMTLFDFAGEEEKKQYRITMPDLPEYPKEELLAFEKELLGVYVSGHPMEEYLETWKSNITAKTSDFLVDEESGEAVVRDNDRVTIGGMIAGKVIKTTRTGKMMAFITVEDMVGSVEVLVFPRDFELCRDRLVEEAKVFVRGRVSLGEEPAGKLICEQLTPFDQVPRDLWLKFADKADYDAKQKQVMELLKTAEGNDTVIIYLEKERARKVLPANWRVAARGPVLEQLCRILGEKNVKAVEKGLKR
jgi:DNA polymerase-3 subunit alpha